MATKKKELLEQEAPVTETVMSEGETLPADTAQPESLPADTGNSLDLNELLGQMDQPLEDTSAEDMAEDPLPELTEEEMFGNTPSETDDQSAAPTDMPEDSDVQPPDVYEDNADAVQEPPASPKPKRTSRKKKEAAAPEETVTEEVPAETTESADTADSILDTEEPAVEPDVPVVEEAAAPAPTPSPPQRQPRPQRGEAPVLTIRSRDDVETAEDRDDVIWHEIHNAYRTRKIITGKLGGNDIVRIVPGFHFTQIIQDAFFELLEVIGVDTEEVSLVVMFGTISQHLFFRKETATRIRSVCRNISGHDDRVFPY